MFFIVTSGFIFGQVLLSIIIFLFIFLIAPDSCNSLIFLLVVSFGMLSFLVIDSKKHYSTNRTVHQKKLIAIQKKTFINLSKFAERIYNLSLIEKIIKI